MVNVLIRYKINVHDFVCDNSCVYIEFTLSFRRRSSQAAHLRHLNELVEAQAQYYEQAHKVMVDLQKEMARSVGSRQVVP